MGGGSSETEMKGDRPVLLFYFLDKHSMGIVDIELIIFRKG